MDSIKKLQYIFKDKALLKAALTHRSLKNNHNNERLEFLGDALLNFVITGAIFNKLPHAREGDLTRVRAKLVCEETLASLARDLELGRHVRLGIGEKKSGGFERDSILADALEAVIAAIYLDGGLESCRLAIEDLYEPFLDHLDPSEILKDPKTRLQEYLQARQLNLPEYNLIKTTGDDHQQIFYIQCKVSIEHLNTEKNIETEGVASSRRKAEQEAAKAALEMINLL